MAAHFCFYTLLVVSILCQHPLSNNCCSGFAIRNQANCGFAIRLPASSYRLCYCGLQICGYYTFGLPVPKHFGANPKEQEKV